MINYNIKKKKKKKEKGEIGRLTAQKDMKEFEERVISNIRRSNK